MKKILFLTRAKWIFDEKGKKRKKRKNIPIAMKISLTFIAVLAEVSINSKPFSSAYCFASSYSTTRLFDKSALLPAKAITMFGEAFKVQESIKMKNVNNFDNHTAKINTHLSLKLFNPSFCPLKTVLILNVIHDDGSLCSSIVHRS